MQVVTDINFNGTSIAPTYANLSVSGGQVVIASLGATNIDDIQKNDLTPIVNAIVGGTLTQVVATVSLTNQTASAGPTNVLTTPNDGLNHFYRFSGFLYDTTVGSGADNMTITYGFTTPTGTTFFQPPWAASSGVGATQGQGTVCFMSGPNTTITYNLIRAGAGAGVWSVFMMLERLS